MADVARVGLTLAGGAFFGPVGALVGGLLGNILFPQKLPDVKGPRLNELNVQRSTVGAPIPIVYGTARLAGNVDFHGGLVEVQNDEEVGGKGGGTSQTVTTYNYFVDLGILICESEDGRPSKIAGIRRIWAYGDVIYDLTPQRDDETTEDYNARIATSNQTAELMTVYLGDETQLPSPMIESHEGVGNVPAFRGYCRVEFLAFPLNKYGKAVPNFTFEVFTVGTASDVDCSELSVGNLYPWLEGVNDPRDPRNVHQYAGPGSGYTTFYDTIEEAIDDGLDGYRPDRVHGWSVSSTPDDTAPCNGDATVDRINLMLEMNTLDQGGPYECEAPDIPGASAGEKLVSAFGPNNTFHFAGMYEGHASAAADVGFINLVQQPNISGPNPCPAGMTGSVEFDSIHGYYIRFCRSRDQEIRVRRTLQPPDPCDGGAPLANAPGFCVIDGEVTRALTWTLISGTFKALQKYANDGNVVTAYPVNPCLALGDPNYNDATYWTAAYDAAVIAGDMAPGLTYGVDYPMTATSAYQASCEGTAVEVQCVAVADIVADICDRVGLSSDTDARVDVSDLQSCVFGYVVTRPMAAREAIGPLRTYGLFDARESDDTLVFRERGGAITATIDADELCAHDAKSERPPPVDIVRVQEKDMPRRVRVHYANLDQNHEPAEQSASRTSTEAVSELDVELPIVMRDDNAAQLAEIYLTEAYDAREVYKFAVSNRWLSLEPADPIDLEIDGELQRCRVTAIDYALGGVLQVEAVRDDATTYGSTAAGVPSQPSGDQGSPDQLVCPSEMVILDLPRLRREDVDCGYYVAPYGLCASWECAGIYRSSDGGSNYQRVAQAEVQATVGELAAISGNPTGPSDIGASPIDYDTFNTIDVTLLTIGATLSSVTDAQIIAGYNLAAIGLDGRWVLVQFKTATLNTDGTYTLSDLLWGLFDSDLNMGTTVAGDSFVLMSGPGILRIGETVNNLGVTKQLKAVTCGSTVDDADAVDFATQCLSYEAPITVDPDGPITIDSDNIISLPPGAELDNNARVGVRKNSGATTFLRRRLNLIEGSNVTLTVTDDNSDEEVDITIAASGSGGGQAGIQFKDEGSNLGTSGTVTSLDFVGAAITATRSTDAVTVTTTAVAGPGSATDNALVRFDGTTGKLVQNSGTTLSDSDVVATPNASAAEVGFKGIPQNSQTTNYTLVLDDAGKCIYKGSGGTVTITIPANGSVAYPVGTCIEGINDDTETLTIAITTDTLVMYRTGATGSRSVSPRGYWQIRKVDTTRWYIGGDGVT